MRLFRRLLLLIVLVLTLMPLSSSAVIAGDLILSSNSGSDRSPWIITGEASLVINGFDLNAQGVTLPTTLDQISIDVAVATPAASVVAVVYQDANGGSPADATLVRQETTTINATGVYTYTFSTPVVITQPVIWVGFYLPVGFEFYSDSSGASVLTYWAWEPGSTFSLTSLSSASVLGPADGSSPVDLNLGGVARITAELVTGSEGDTPATTETPTTLGSSQIAGPQGVSLAPLVNYAECGPVYFDSEDIRFTYRSAIRFECKSYTLRFNPQSPDGYELGSTGLFDLRAYGEEAVSSGTNRLRDGVTHCIAPPADDVANAVLGLAYGAPREWEILTTVRFGDVICAEVFYSGYLAYFVPN